jgi:hypothetical protein
VAVSGIAGVGMLEIVIQGRMLGEGEEKGKGLSRNK